VCETAAERYKNIARDMEVWSRNRTSVQEIRERDEKKPKNEEITILNK